MKPAREPRRGPATNASGMHQVTLSGCKPSAITATQAKNEFSSLLEKAIRGETVVITKHNAPKAVLISMERFDALRHAPEAKLNTLSGEFDSLLARLQKPQMRSRMDSAFCATPQELGEAAVAAARKRG